MSQEPNAEGKKRDSLPVLIGAGVGGAVVAALLFFLLSQVAEMIRGGSGGSHSAAITEDWILGSWEIVDGCGSWYRYQQFRREGGAIEHYASRDSLDNMEDGGWDVTGFDPATQTWSGPGWTLTASGDNLIVQHDSTCTWTRAGASSASPAAAPVMDASAIPAPPVAAGGRLTAAQVIERIGAIRATYYNEEFLSEFRSFFVPTYDQNGSNDIDTAAEVNAIPCEVLVRLHQRMHSDSSESGLVWTEGFAPGFTYVGYGVGINESMREPAYSRMLSCGVPDASR